jgi:hypothetical protein
MRRQLAIAAASLLSACAAVQKLPAVPPPVEGTPTPTASLQPAPTAWYQPFRSDGSAEEKRLGLGVLKAKYDFIDKASSMKTKVDLTSASGPTLQVGPISSDLLSVFFSAGMPFFGFGWGDSTLDFTDMAPVPTRIPIKMYGLYEGVRVPITLADFKGPDIQLLLVPGFTAQVFYMTGSEAGYDASGLIIGGSLNVAGVGVAVGDWLVLEADFWKWGWSYVVDLTVDRPDGTSLAGSFSGFSYGVAPVFYARALF